VIEPVSANSLEAMERGMKTTYEHVAALPLGELLKEDLGVLPEPFRAGFFCEDLEFRARCCARTWKRPHALENLLTLVPLGESRSDFNVDYEKNKRILNFVNVVSDDDNIKQDKSIDVYDRYKDEEGGDKKEDADDIEKLYNA